MSKLRRIFWVILSPVIALTGCMTQSAVDEMIEHAEILPAENSEVKIPNPSLAEHFPSLREKSQTMNPSKIHIGWDIFQVGELIYGKRQSNSDFEFVAREIETPPSKIVLVGHATAATTVAGTYHSTESGRITITPDNKILIEGGVSIGR